MATKKKRSKWFVKKGEAGSIDLVFLILVLCLLTFGLIMLASASYVSALHKYGDSYHYIKRQLLFALMGVAMMLTLPHIFDYQALRRLSIPLFGVSVLMLGLVLIPGIGVKVNGARRWLNLGIQFQPSDVAKFALILIFAAYMAANYKRMKEFKVGIMMPAAALLLVCGMVLGEPHLSGAILIFAIGAVMMLVGGMSLKWFTGIGLTGIAGVALVALTTPYMKERLETWLHPEMDPTGDGFQTLQSLYAIGSGGLLGVGLGQSTQKHLYIPEPQNDYIFAIVCEELGFVGAMMVIILFVLLIWRGFVIAYHARDKFGSLLVVGIMSHVAIQTILNIGVVTNALPPTGISLPFFSYGGTSLLILLFEMTVVLAVSRYSRMEIKE